MGAPDASLKKTAVRRGRRGGRQIGQSMVEFALIIVLIAVVAIAVVMTTGNQVVLSYQDIQEALMNPGDPGATSPYPCPDGTIAVLHGHKYHCQ